MVTGGKPWTMREIPYQIVTSGNKKQVMLDLQYNQPLVDEDHVTFNDSGLIFVSVYVPLFVMLGMILSNRQHPRSRKVLEGLSVFYGLLFSVGTTELVVNVLKLYVGRLRPNFYGLCGFDLQEIICTASLEHQYQARKSFPSGHSSLSFTGMTFLLLFMFGRYRLGSGWCSGGVFYSHLCLRFRWILCMLPWSLSLWVASSRLVDHWHHAGDVVAGSVIGIFGAALGYLMWFPYPLGNKESSIPTYMSTDILTSSLAKNEQEPLFLQYPDNSSLNKVNLV